MRTTGSGPATPPTLSPSIVFRDAVLDDLEAITEIYNEAVLRSTATFDTETSTVDARLPWFRAHSDRYPILIAFSRGRVLGWASLSRWSERPAYDLTAETSVYIREDQRGKGIGRALMEKIIDRAVTSGFHVLIARIAEGSNSSLRLHARLGFKEIGIMHEVGHKFGRFLDVHINEMILATTP